MQEIGHSLRTLPAKIERFNVKEKWAGLASFVRKNKDVLQTKAADLQQKFGGRQPDPEELDNLEEEEEVKGEPILPEAKELKAEIEE